VNARVLVVGVVASVMLCASDISAQPVSPPPAGDWQIEFVPYLWGSAIDGDVGIGSRSAIVDASFSNILSHLHVAFMGALEARRDRLVILTDFVYTDLSGHRATPGPLFSSVDPEQKLVILTSEGGFRLVNSDGAAVDLVGGVRFWGLRSELEFGAGVLPSVGMTANRDWADAIGGLKARVALLGNWWVSGYGDFGGGGSKRTYQLSGTGGVDFHTRYAFLVGYRYLKVDYDNDGVLFDNELKGPLFGFALKW
jgi:hypothetical protein